MNQEIELRLAKFSEASQIAILSRDLIETGLGWSWTPARVASSIRCADTNVLVGCNSTKVGGFAIMRYWQHEAHLDLLGVVPTNQRQGLGRRLVQWLEESALVAGVSIVYLEVRAGNQGAQSFYKRLGYRKIARIPGYYCGRESAIRMGRDLWCRNSADAT